MISLTLFHISPISLIPCKTQRLQREEKHILDNLVKGTDKVEHGSQKYEPSLLVQEPNVLRYHRNILEPSLLSREYSGTEAEG